MHANGMEKCVFRNFALFAPWLGLLVARLGAHGQRVLERGGEMERAASMGDASI